MGENVLVYGKFAVKYLGVMGPYVCNGFSNGTEKIIE